jgi:hypothetical protein
MIERELKPYHKQVVASIRLALLDGYSARQIGKAYGSSDANTIKRLIAEAEVGSIGIAQAVATWELQDVNGDEFTLIANGLGDDKFTGKGRFVIDDDGENISVTHGDFALQSVAYRAGIVPSIIQEVRSWT